MHALPGPFVHYLRNLADEPPWGISTHRTKLLNHLATWRRHPKTIMPLPGYTTPPANAPGLNHPAGWSKSNFDRIARDQQKLQLR